MTGIKHSENCSSCHECIVCMRHGKKIKLCDDCYRKDVITRLKVRKVKRSLKEALHRPVQYSQGEGWRIGYLLEFGPTAARVQPIGTIGGPLPNPIRIPIEDLMAERCSSPKMPTVEDYYIMAEQNRKKTVVLVADQTSSAVTKAIEYLMNRPVDHKFGSAPVLKPEDAPVPVEPEGKFIHAEASDEVFAEKMKVQRPDLYPVQSPAPSTEHEQPQKVNKKPKPVPKVSMPVDVAVPRDTEPTKPRTKHAPVDLTEAQRLYETGSSINDVVAAVKGTRAAFDVKKLVRKTFKELGILKD